MLTLNLNALINKLNNTCQQALEAAIGLCVSHTQMTVELEHWLLKLIDMRHNNLMKIFNYYQINITQLHNDLIKRIETYKAGYIQTPTISQDIFDACQIAWLIATLEFDADQISEIFLLLALLHDTRLKQIMRHISIQFTKLNSEALKTDFSKIIDLKKNIPKNMRNSNNASTALNQFTVNLNEKAQKNQLDAAIARENEIRQMIDILYRRHQNNPILVGDPGVGKTAIVEGLALRIQQKNVPKFLQNTMIRTLDLGLLQAGAGIKGEFENRLKSIIKEAQAAPYPIILFIDEAHTLIGAGNQAGQSDAANLLKPALARGELRTIAATTWVEYKKYFETDAALSRRFEAIKVNEPNEQQTLYMLRGLLPKLEEHHQIKILDEALINAVRLTKRYLPNRLLPDIAVNVLDTACARVATKQNIVPPLIEDQKFELMHIDNEIQRLIREETEGRDHQKKLSELKIKTQKLETQLAKLNKQWDQEKILIDKIKSSKKKLQDALQINNKTKEIKIRQQLQQYTEKLSILQGDQPLLDSIVNKQVIAKVIADQSSIPIGRMMKNEINLLLNLENELQNHILGQTDALKRIATTIQSSRAQLTNPHKPMGVFLFVGPSGVGKTETAHVLAELLYGSRDHLHIINMSEFKEVHKVSLLTGSPPGYIGYGEGGILTESVRRQPYSLLLFDEFEKAHPSTHDMFYQVFDKGILKDGQGREIDFKNTLIIMTSNVCNEILTQLDQQNKELSIEKLRTLLDPELKKYFKPAFLGRVTIVPYFSLDKESLRKITVMELEKLNQRLQEHYNIQITYKNNTINHIVSLCEHLDTGARQIETIITQRLVPQLSTNILQKIAERKTLSNFVLKTMADQLILY